MGGVCGSFMSTNSEEEALLPELLLLICALARALDDGVTRARLRLVCWRFWDEDRTFVSPDWTWAHPDIRRPGSKHRRLGTKAARCFDRLCADVATAGWWARLPCPTSIRWCRQWDYPKRWHFDRGGYRLRIEWPSHRGSGDLRLYNVLSIRPCSDVTIPEMHYESGHTHWEYAEYHGSASFHVNYCLPD